MQGLYPIWRKIASGRFYSDITGGARFYDQEVQDWGLLVNGVVYGLLITGRSSTNAMFGVEHWQGPTQDFNAFRSLSTPFATTQLSPAGSYLMPWSSAATTNGTRMPFFRPRVIADSFLSQEDWWEGEIWAGGSPF